MRLELIVLVSGEWRVIKLVIHSPPFFSLMLGTSVLSFLLKQCSKPVSVPNVHVFHKRMAEKHKRLMQTVTSKPVHLLE